MTSLRQQRREISLRSLTLSHGTLSEVFNVLGGSPCTTFTRMTNIPHTSSKPDCVLLRLDSTLYGEFLIKEVYEALRKSPNWNHTLFWITYDEHGGLYDHVPPPQNGTYPHIGCKNFRCSQSR